MSGLSRAEVNLSQEISQPSPATSMLRFAVCAIVVFAAAGYASSFTPGPWYLTLQSPVGTPPNWIFPPVWSVLYALLAISFWWFWEQADAKPPTSKQIFRLGAAVFVVQLIANALWSQFFFWLALDGSGTDQYCVLMALDSGHDADLSPKFSSGCKLIAALSGMGGICDLSECRICVSES